MKKLILLAITLICLAGCGDEGSKTSDSYNTTIINITTTTNIDGSHTITYTYSDGSVRTEVVPAGAVGAP